MDPDAGEPTLADVGHTRVHGRPRAKSGRTAPPLAPTGALSWTTTDDPRHRHYRRAADRLHSGAGPAAPGRGARPGTCGRRRCCLARVHRPRRGRQHACSPPGASRRGRQDRLAAGPRSADLPGSVAPGADLRRVGGATDRDPRRACGRSPARAARRKRRPHPRSTRAPARACGRPPAPSPTAGSAPRFR